MRKLLIALAIAGVSVTSTVVYAQSQTYATSGTFNGQQYTSITLTNHGNGTYSATLHFTNGSQFTQSISEANYQAMLNHFEQPKNLSGD